MKLYTNIDCVECGKTVEVSVEKESYGADADGRRGIAVLTAEIESQKCDCELSGFDKDEICDEAINDLRDEF